MLQEASSSAQKSDHSVSSHTARLQRDIEALREDVNRWGIIAEDAARELEAQMAEQRILQQRFSIASNSANFSRNVFRGLQRRLGDYGPHADEETCPASPSAPDNQATYFDRDTNEYHAEYGGHHGTQEYPTPTVKVERETTDLPPTPVESYEARDQQRRAQIHERYLDNIRRSRARALHRPARGRGMPPWMIRRAEGDNYIPEDTQDETRSQISRRPDTPVTERGDSPQPVVPDQFPHMLDVDYA
jgi:hypothetical protein